jgi:hypothetical protein
MEVQGQKWETKCHLPVNPRLPGFPPQEECTQSTFFSVSRFEGENLQGFMIVSVSLSDEGETTCEAVTEALGVAAGAMNGIAGGCFGALNLACTA